MNSPVLPCALLLLLPGLAHAYGTEPIELLLTEELDLMPKEPVYTTGYLPSEDSFLAIRFSLEASETAQVEMETLAELTWPEAVTLVWTPLPQTGWLALYGELATVIELKLDVAGYQDEWELDRRSIEVQAETEFDPLVLSDSTQDSVYLENEGDGTTLFEYDFTVFEVVGITLDIDVATTLATTMAGIEIDHDGEAVQLLEADIIQLDVPGNGYMEVTSEYLAWWETAMQVLIQPGVAVSALGIGYEWDDIVEVAVEMGANELEDPFDPVTYEFYLPVMEAPDASYDFGDLYVGELANWNVELANGGVEILEGEATVSGSEYFFVYPGSILADAEDYDGLVVSFQPDSTGAFEATLLLATNDPAEPVYEVLLTGTGIEDIEDEMAVLNTEVGCGCHSPGRRAHALWLLALAPLLIARRRRQR